MLQVLSVSSSCSLLVTRALEVGSMVLGAKSMYSVTGSQCLASFYLPSTLITAYLSRFQQPKHFHASEREGISQVIRL